MVNVKLAQAFSIAIRQARADGNEYPPDLTGAVQFSWIANPEVRAVLHPAPDDPSFVRVRCFGEGPASFQFTAIGKNGDPVFSKGIAGQVTIVANAAVGEPKVKVAV